MAGYLLSYLNGVTTALDSVDLKAAKREAESRVEACRAFAGGNVASIVDKSTYKVVAEVANFGGNPVSYEPIQKDA